MRVAFSVLEVGRTCPEEFICTISWICSGLFSVEEINNLLSVNLFERILGTNSSGPRSSTPSGCQLNDEKFIDNNNYTYFGLMPEYYVNCSLDSQDQR